MHAIYDRYAMMKPFVGTKYVRGDPQSLLLVGESHYQPKLTVSTQHLSAEQWYSSDSSTLGEEEMGYINTAEIVNGSIAESFRNRAHSIYRNSFRVINQNGPQLPEDGHVGEIIVFYNYFLRPARHGASLRVEKEDERIAKDVFGLMVDEYRPAAVVFLSRLAFRTCEASGALPIAVPVIATPHPGCAHWNRPSVRYGGKSGRELLVDFIKQIWQTTDTIKAPAASE